MLITWFDNRDEVLIWCLLLIFWRCRWIGIRPAIAYVDNVQKTLVIQIAVFIVFFWVLWENAKVGLCWRTTKEVYRVW